MGADVDAGFDAHEGIATWRVAMSGADVVITSLGGALSPDLGPAIRRILAA
jgi:hypothetical protein